MLYLVATPIGNLSDITHRAIEVLSRCDYILCEDTRHSLHLLKHYHIHKPLKSYHKFNEKAHAEKIWSHLAEGQHIALISDAGTPTISDPGHLLITGCIERQLSFTAIPGPCAILQALICSGLTTERFQFCGFLPRKQGELKETLQEYLGYPGTTICYESPKRLLDVLHLLATLDPKRPLVVARELTKTFEEFRRGTAHQLLEIWETTFPKGEIVLLLGPAQNSSQTEWLHLSPIEHVNWVQDTYHTTRQEAIKIVAQLRQVPKKEVYNLIMKK